MEITDITVITVEILSYGDLLGRLLSELRNIFLVVQVADCEVTADDFFIFISDILRDGVEDATFLALSPLSKRCEGEVGN